MSETLWEVTDPAFSMTYPKEVQVAWKTEHTFVTPTGQRWKRQTRHRRFFDTEKEAVAWKLGKLLREIDRLRRKADYLAEFFKKIEDRAIENDAQWKPDMTPRLFGVPAKDFPMADEQ